MRFGGIALLGSAVAVLATAGSAFAANPITVVLAATGQPAGSSQTCVSVVTTDSVSNQPVAADVDLQIGDLSSNPITHALTGGGTVVAKTDFSGKGSVWFDQPPMTFSSANVTLYLGTSVIVHGSPDYTTTGTSNTVTVRWGSAGTSASIAVTPTSSSSSLVMGVADTVNVAISYNAANTAQAPTLEIDLSGAAASVSSATATSGSCSGTTTVTCSLADLPKGGSATVTLQLTPGSSGQLALAFDLRWHTTLTPPSGPVITSPSNQTATLNLAVTPPTADVSVALATTSHAIRIGKAATVTAVVRDLGPQPALGTKVVFAVPGTVKLIRFTGTGFTCSSVARTCTVASVTSSSSARIGLSLVPTKAGTRQLSATATVAGATDPALANNTGRIALTVLPKLPIKH